MDRLREIFDIDVLFTHFPLHPETPEAGLTLEQLFAGRSIDVAAAKMKMSRLMAEEKLPYGERVMTYNSRRAQELAKWVTAKGGAISIHDSLFQAYFVDGRNIANIDTLVEIARVTGESAEEAHDVLTKGTFAQQVDRDWQRSRQLDITGVPTFLVGQHLLVGAQSYHALVQLLVAGGAKRRSEAC